MMVYGLYVNSITLYYMIVEHVTPKRAFYARVDMASSSVEYRNLPIES